MSTIVTRAGKGSPLTNNEVDANFVNLNTDKIQVTGTPVNGYTILWDSATSTWVPGISGSGDVNGPASATDNALARFDGTTGKLIQNSVATLSDAGALATANATADYYAWNTGAGVTPAVGQRAWDASQGTTALGLLGGNVITRDGQSLVAYVTNAEAVTITKGQAVYLFSAVGDRASVKLAYNTGDATSAKTLGIVAEDIAAGQAGFVMCQGVAYKIDTSTYSSGASLYLGATPGSLTTTKPYAPNHLVYIGTVERANAGNGQIYVRVQNGYELDEIHNVSAQSPTNGQTIVYNSTTSLWEAKTLDSLPSQTGNSGKYLTTNGTVASWATVSGGGTNSYTRTTFTATAGQTTFTVAYSVGYVQVYLNGVLLYASDYTASNGTSIVLATGATVGDIVDVIAYSTNAVGTVSGSNITGNIPVTNLNSGTGASSSTYWRGDGTWATVSSLPSQTGNTGKYLTTDGTNPSWATVVTGGGPITQNADSVSANQTIASGSNGFSVGPITIQSGYTVTVASGQRWVII